MSLEVRLGLIATIISAIGLLGVSVSLLLQARQTKIAAMEAARTRQFELMRLTYEYPELARVWINENKLPLDWRTHTYTNLVWNYLRMVYLLGDAQDHAVRRSAAEKFAADEHRKFWAYAGPYFADTYGKSRPSMRFYGLVQEEYLKAVARFGEPPSVS